jgi:hypothetical protein
MAYAFFGPALAPSPRPFSWSRGGRVSRVQLMSPNSLPLFWMGGMVSSAYFIRVFRFLCYTCRFGAEKILRICYHCRVASEDSLSVCICCLYTHPGPWSETVHTIWDMCAIVYQHTTQLSLYVNVRTTLGTISRNLCTRCPSLSDTFSSRTQIPNSRRRARPSRSTSTRIVGSVVVSSRSTGKGLRNHGTQNKSGCSGPSESSLCCGWS